MIYTSAISMGNRILFRGREGKVLSQREIKSGEYGPRMWTEDQSGEWTDVRNEVKLKERRFDSIASWRQCMKTYKGVSNIKLYGLERPEYQWIQEQFSRDAVIDYADVRIAIIDLEVNSSNGFPLPELAAEPITACTIYDSHDDTYYTWSTAQWDREKSELEPQLADRVKYIFCKSEAAMIALVLNWWVSNCPDVISGWNSDGFDCMYLYNRIIIIGDQMNGKGEELAQRLSPWNKVNKRTFTNRFGKEQDEVEFLGINHLDYEQLYIKHTLKMRDSYKLNNIAFIELNDTKLNYDEAKNLHTLYAVNPQKFVDYNIKDVDIVVRLNKKLKLFELVIDMAVVSGVNFKDTFSPVKMWDVMVYDYLIGQKTAIPMGRNTDWSDGTYEWDGGKFEGAFVKEPKRGLFGWMLSFDYTSLYPSIMRQWNFGVDTIVNHVEGPLAQYSEMQLVEKYLEDGPELKEIQKELQKAGLCLAMNGTFYRVDNESFMNVLMRKLFLKRKETKGRMQVAQRAQVGLKSSDPKYKEYQSIINSTSTREQALKILLNSGYGATGNQYFRFFDVRVAEAVTITGRMVTQWIERELNKLFAKILKETNNASFVNYIDTDSVYLDVSKFVASFVKASGKTSDNDIADFLDDFAKKLRVALIDPQNERLRALTNCREQLLDLKRESIGSAAFWKSKKLYAMRIVDSEGVRKTKMKVMGLEAVKSTTAPMIRKALMKCYEIILESGDNAKLIQSIDAFHDEYSAAPLEDIAKGSSVTDLGKYSDSSGNAIKGAPQQVKAALIYNLMKSRYDSTCNLDDIRDGDKIKILKLRLPNPLKSDVIGYNDYFPRGIVDEKYIDRERMFEDGFLSPMRDVCGTFGWNVENMNDLTSFFA